MKLFRYEGYKITISEEALILKPFKDIWKRDKSSTKDKAIQELGFVYFMEDPRSDYQYIVDREARKESIKEGEGLPKDWQPDSKVEEAMKFYSNFKSTATLLLEDTRAMIDGYRNKIRKLTEDMADMSVKESKEVGAMIKEIPTLVKNLDEAEKAIAREIAQSDKVRGSLDKAVYEDL